MRLQSVTCDRCGEPVRVITTAAIYADTEQLLKSNGSQNAPEISCRIDCPSCGPRIQIVKSERG
jgi:hypothetical protein